MNDNHAPVTREKVMEALRSVRDPELHVDLVTLKWIKDVRIEDGDVFVQVVLTTPACPMKTQIREDIEKAVACLDGVRNVAIDFEANVAAARTANRQPIEGIRNIVAIASGKGGVGKSTISALLALALHREGARVGLFDADIYGPSIPRMLGMTDMRPVPGPSGRILPVERAGIKAMSMGFLVPGSQAVIWRGPMVHKALQEFMYQVEWGELDYLLVDLPPGTGDAQLTMCQSIPLAGVVAITTPQEVAATIAAKVLNMFHEMKIPALGVIENMATFHCPHCNEATRIFGEGGGTDIARATGVPMLGSLPLDPLLCREADMGEMGALMDGEQPLAQEIRRIARDLAARLSTMNYASQEDAATV